MTYEPKATTPVERAVGIIRDFMMGSINVEELESAIDTFQDAAHTWANNQLRDQDGFSAADIDELHANQEDFEDMKIYDRYYYYLTQFGRKVLTAAANSY